jgi:uncharacterized protein
MNRTTILALAIPFLLLPSTALVFKLSVQIAGREAGYLIGFGFYWLIWCILAPHLILGKAEFANLLKDHTPLVARKNWLAALLWVVVMIVTVAMYGQDFLRAPFLLIAVAIPLATINGLCEEILWRGLYVRLFPGNPWLGIIFPAAGFALWHFAPQIAIPDQNGIGFVVSTLFLGLAYGFIAWRTGSAKWTVISHSLSGVLALSGWLAPSLLTLLS